jgi:hypothetical protein
MRILFNVIFKFYQHSNPPAKEHTGLKNPKKSIQLKNHVNQENDTADLRKINFYLLISY